MIDVMLRERESDLQFNIIMVLGLIPTGVKIFYGFRLIPHQKYMGVPDISRR